MYPLDDVIMIIVCSRFIWCLDWNIPGLLHWLWGNCPSASEVILGWGLLSQFPPFRYFPNFPSLSKQTLVIEYHVYIWLVSKAVKYECDSRNLTGTFAWSKISLTDKLTNGALVPPTPEWHGHNWTKLNHVKPQKHAHRLLVCSNVLQWFIMGKLYRRFVRWMSFFPNYAFRHIAVLIFVFRLITLSIL